jgi:thiamine biosynthesis lipoprotein
VRELWGTAISVDVDEPVDPQLVADAFTWFERVDALFSTWRADSEISRLAAGALRDDELSDEVRVVLQRCESLRIETAGGFDVRATARIPVARRTVGWCALDPSGMVKGWAIERAADRLQAAGVERLCINAGGDVVVRGRVPWRVGVQHPFDRGAIAAVVDVTDAGVATSGRYERGDHIVDPRTGAPARGLASVTVVARDLAMAEAFATAAVAFGLEGIEWLGSKPDVAAMVITDDGEVLVTPAFDRLRRAAGHDQSPCPASASASRS